MLIEDFSHGSVFGVAKYLKIAFFVWWTTDTEYRQSYYEEYSLWSIGAACVSMM